jgi:hypothetical protein
MSEFPAPWPWMVVRSFNGVRVVRTWSSCFYQVLCIKHIAPMKKLLAPSPRATQQ